MIGVLTGSIGIGKTTVCQRLVALLRGRGLKPAGVLAPSLVDASGRKIGIRLLRVETGEERALALMDRELQGPRTGRYAFDAAVMDWGLSGLRSALRGEYDFVVIDEIGPLELRRNEGLAPVLEELRELDGSHVLIVVRETLVEALKERLDRPDLATFPVDIDVRGDLARGIEQWYFPQLLRGNGS